LALVLVKLRRRSFVGSEETVELQRLAVGMNVEVTEERLVQFDAGWISVGMF
jgi:hypothetical protein